MGNLKVGDIVARKSYGADVFFKVVDIKNNGKENIVTLKGITYRIQADAPESDLILQNDQKVEEYNSRCYKEIEKKDKENVVSKTRGNSKKGFFRSTAKDSTRKFSQPGKILHI